MRAGALAFALASAALLCCAQIARAQPDGKPAAKPAAKPARDGKGRKPPAPRPDTAVPVRPEPPGPAAGVLPQLVYAVRTKLDDAADSHVARPAPPVRVAPVWKPRKLGTLELGAPVVAVTAADLDRDGKAELYVVTTNEVVAATLGNGARELARVAFTGEPAVPASRDVVGTVVIDDPRAQASATVATVASSALIVAVSSWAKDMRVSWEGKQLVGKPGTAGFRVCGDRLLLAPGRNHFREGGAALIGARCRGDLIDAAGLPLRLRGELGATGTLDVKLERCAVDGNACRLAGSYRYKDIGAAFELADVDRDGAPDLVASSASAPGAPDTVRVIALGAPAARPMYKRAFPGGVAGLAVVDSDGDGLVEVFAVIRLAGAARVEVWRLD